MADSSPAAQSWADRPLLILAEMLGIRPLRGLLIALVFIVKTAPVLLFPLFVEHVIATLSEDTPPGLSLIIWPALFLIFLQLLNIPAHTLFMHMVSRHIRDAERKLRTGLVRKLQYLPLYVAHHSNHSFYLHTRLLLSLSAFSFPFRDSTICRANSIAVPGPCEVIIFLSTTTLPSLGLGSSLSLPG